jgi:hypothetical protein
VTRHRAHGQMRSRRAAESGPIAPVGSTPYLRRPLAFAKAYGGDGRGANPEYDPPKNVFQISVFRQT